MIHKHPIIDDQNPFYCPSVTAIAYLESLRQQMHSARDKHRNSAHTHKKLSLASDDVMLSSFTTLLDQSVTEDDLLELLYRPAHSGHDENDTSSSSLGTTYSVPSRAHQKKDGNSRNSTVLESRRQRSHGSDTCSDLRGPFRREKSSVTVNDGSFELSAKAERLRYFLPKTGYSPYETRTRPNKKSTTNDLTVGEMICKIRHLEDELYGPVIGTESPRGLNHLISRLTALLPGIRLREKIYALDTLNHQRIVDMLSVYGNLNSRVLDLFRMSEIECLDLTASMTDEEGLNLDARDLLQVLAKPNSFVFLNEINLSGTHLNDFDITNIHHLPRLSRLWISNTGIGNEAIFLLTSLKRTLKELDIAFNPSIDNDSIPALIALHKLRFITLLDTSVSMPGLRRLCAVICERKHTVDVEVPRECEVYIEKMGNQYVLQPELPLIDDPSVVSELSNTALQRNLAAHAVFNPDILVGGTRGEMAERLMTLLETRAADLLVRQVLWSEDEQANNNGKPFEFS